MKSLETGQILEVLGTDPGTIKDMAKLAKKSGHEWLGHLDQDEGFFRFYLKKGERKKKEK